MPLRKIRNPRSFDKCRMCHHSFISHTTADHKPCACQFLVYGNCRCIEFFPEDNLEFLEYKYVNRK